MTAEDLRDLTILLTDCDATRKVEAAERLAELGPDARQAAASLVRAMGDPNEEVRELVAAALEELGSPPLGNLPELARLLEDPSADVGYWAATLLGRLGEAGADAVSPLIDAGGGASREKPSHQTVSERSVWALGKIGPPAAGALPLLRKLAESADNARLSRLASAAIEQIDRRRTDGQTRGNQASAWWA